MDNEKCVHLLENYIIFQLIQVIWIMVLYRFCCQQGSSELVYFSVFFVVHNVNFTTNENFVYLQFQKPK